MSKTDKYKQEKSQRKRNIQRKTLKFKVKKKKYFQFLKR